MVVFAKEERDAKTYITLFAAFVPPFAETTNHYSLLQYIWFCTLNLIESLGEGRNEQSKESEASSPSRLRGTLPPRSVSVPRFHSV